MQGIREYFLSIAAAAVICALAKHMVGQKGTGGKIIQMITGLFLVITLIAPIRTIKFDDIEYYFDDIRYDAEEIVSNGTKMANDALGNIIKEQIEAYILDEATRLGTQMDVEVKLSDSNPPKPSQVTIKGSVSPYQKQCISQYLSQSFGISQEHQIWN